MREKLFVEDIVKLYKMPNGNLSESIGLLKEYMLNLIVSLHAKDSGEDIPIFDGLTIMLHKVLTAQDEKEIETFCLALELQEFLTVMHQLSTLSKKDESCQAALVRMQQAFAGECIVLAAQYDVSSRQEVLLFKQQNLGMIRSAELEELEKQQEIARENFEKVEKFCSRYRVSI